MLDDDRGALRAETEALHNEVELMRGVVAALRSARHGIEGTVSGRARAEGMRPILAFFLGVLMTTIGTVAYLVVTSR